jgi:hypothetical protein
MSDDAVEGEAEAVEGDAEAVEDEDTELPEGLDPDDAPEKFQGPEGRDEGDIPEGVD